MSFAAFKTAFAQLRQTKTLDTIISGSNSKWLREGEHEVTIQGVEWTQDNSTDRINFTFVDAAGNTFDDRTYLMSQDQKEMGKGIRNILAAVIPSTEAFEQFFTQLEANNKEVFNMFTGMRLKITLGYSNGFTIKSTTNGTYQVFSRTFTRGSNSKTETLVGPTEYTSQDDAKAAAKASGMYQSVLRIQRTAATHAEANIQAFTFACAARNKMANGSGSFTVTAPAAPAGVTII